MPDARGATRSALAWCDAALLVGVALIWGFNFVVIRWGLGTMPPLLFTALRFVFCAVPWIFFCPRPPVRPGMLLTLGLVLGVGVFGFLFVGIAQGASPGLASLLMQSQVFFTAILSFAVLSERLKPYRVAAVVMGLAGIGLVALRQSSSGNPQAYALVLAGAVCWGVANVLLKRLPSLNMVALMVWISLVPPIPLLALAAAETGPKALLASLTHVGWSGAATVLYTAVLSTIVGYGAWGAMLQRYESAVVAQFSLLVPVFGLMASGLIFGEQHGLVETVAIIVVLSSLVLSSYGHLWSAKPVEDAPI